MIALDCRLGGVIHDDLTVPNRPFRNCQDVTDMPPGLGASYRSDYGPRLAEITSQ